MGATDSTTGRENLHTEICIWGNYVTFEYLYSERWCDENMRDIKYGEWNEKIQKYSASKSQKETISAWTYKNETK